MIEFTEEGLLTDNSISFWLKSQINETKERDLLDALRDAEILTLVLQSRLNKLKNESESE